VSEHRLVVTIAMGPEYQRIAALTHPSLRAYAARIGADFRAITERAVSVTTPHWEKFQIAELLDTYDRVLYLDTDILVREDCEDLFALVPETKLGMFNEAPFADRSRELLIDCCRQYGVSLPSWNGAYYNSGVMVISRRHRPLFVKPEREIFSFYEQTYLNMVIAQYAIPVQDLTHRYNRMNCMDRVIGEHRLACPVVHYAGALNSISVEQLLRVMAGDIERWAREGTLPRYQKHVYVSVNGGLGDQLCAEPAVRFLKEELYPEDDVVVATHWPRAFAHLTGLGVTVCEQGRANLREDTPYYLCTTLPGPETLQWRIVSHLMCHSVDYTSMALMHRTLPLDRRTPKFEVWPQDRQRLAAILGGVDPRTLVAVHPGRHWNTKTFPSAWWQAVLDGLQAAGRTVAVIGKNEPPKPKTDEAFRGTVPVEIRDGMVDLRDQLDLGGLAAFLEVAPTLISNDSAPVHLAGCFDHQIILIPSCKHPDHILPYRQGSLNHQSVALYKKLYLDEVEARPTQAYETSADTREAVDWERYLPGPETVVTAVGGRHG
jgi:hypothetical protein